MLHKKTSWLLSSFILFLSLFISHTFIYPQIVEAVSRPLFGSYIDTLPFNDYSLEKKNFIYSTAKIIYPGSLGAFCDPEDWSNPQAILDKPNLYYGSSITGVVGVLAYPEAIERGIVARGYVYNAAGTNVDRHPTLPQDVSDPRFKQAMEKVESDCVTNLVNAFKPRAVMWGIANEIFQANGTRVNAWQTNQPVDITHKIIAARQADPQSRLYIEDFDIEEVNDKSTGILNYMKQLRNQGHPVDGVGFQGHFSVHEPVNYQSIRSNIQRFKDEGFDVAFTEVDAHLNNAAGTEAQKLAAQKDIFKNVAQICKDFSNCKFFMIFGYEDKNSWLGPDSLATPFDYWFNPKPAWFALDEVLTITPRTFSDVPPTTNGSPTEGFTDLENLVLRESGNGVTISGCGAPDVNGRPPFCPQNLVKRAEMAKLMTVAMEQYMSTATTSAFSDMVNLPTYDYSWATPYAMKMKELGITQGCGNGSTFCPNNNITRREMVLFLSRAFGDFPAYTPPNTGTFPDVPKPSTTSADFIFYKAIEFAKMKGITNGTDGDECNLPQYEVAFCPNSPVSRIRIAMFLMNAFKTPVPAVTSGSVLTNTSPWSVAAEGNNLGRQLTIKVYDTNKTFWGNGTGRVFINSTHLSFKLPSNTPPSNCNATTSCTIYFELIDSDGHTSSLIPVTLPKI